jgi:hypothetical protein
MNISDIKIELKFSPELVITVGGDPLGRIAFKNVDELKEFVPKLKESIEVLIKEFRGKDC